MAAYDVFLTFRGVDTRNKFTGHLLAALERHCFKTFRDDNELRRGEKIGSGLFKAIEKSKISIIVFSKNYASSRWCLDELVKIMDCKETLNQIVIPIFYDVQPSDVRSQRGCYAEAFVSHQKRFDLELVEKWRSALAEAANLSGYNLQNGCESTFIDIVVGEVADKLNSTCLSVAEYPVGIEHRVQELRKLFKLGSNSDDDVRIVAIWEIGGMGKTTIAKAMYNDIHRTREFESCSFLADVGPTSMDTNGLVKLQKKLLRHLLMDENQRIRSEDHGIELIKRAWRRRVFLVLDDVDNIRQLRALVINRNLLCPGSRILVTTRDLFSISSLEVDEVYKLEELKEDESLQLFSWHAFRRERPVKDYEILSEEVVRYSKGLPLVIEILGSFLSGRPIPEWKSELMKLKKSPRIEVQEKLRLSFDSLDEEQKGLFLHIACFFVGMDQDLSIKVLQGCGFFPESGIGVLSHRCLVSIDGHNRLMMHDLIRDMAREIVRQESPEEPGERSRLWYHEDVLDVLRYDTGTKAIQGLVLNLPESKELQLNAKAFTKMERLRVLHLDYVQLSGCLHLTGRLVWLSWKGFSSKCLRSTLITDNLTDNLVAVDLSYSKLQQLWSGTMVCTKLKYLNLGHCYFLIKTPDFTGLSSLENLLLNNCTKLIEVHQSIEYLKNLVVLDLENCQNLEKIPLSIFWSKSLPRFNLSGCSKLEWRWRARFLKIYLSSNFRRLLLAPIFHMELFYVSRCLYSRLLSSNGRCFAHWAIISYLPLFSLLWVYFGLLPALGDVLRFGLFLAHPYFLWCGFTLSYYLPLVFPYWVYSLFDLENCQNLEKSKKMFSLSSSNGRSFTLWAIISYLPLFSLLWVYFGLLPAFILSVVSLFSLRFREIRELPHCQNLEKSRKMFPLPSSNGRCCTLWAIFRCFSLLVVIINLVVGLFLPKS